MYPKNIVLVLIVLVACLSQDSVGSPARSKKHQNQNAEIRSTQLENRFAQKRIEQYKDEERKHNDALIEANEKGVPMGNTNHENWMKEHEKYVETKSNIHRHKLASEILQNHTKVGHSAKSIFDDRMKKLHSSANHHVEKKKKLEIGGTYSLPLEQKTILENTRKLKANISNRAICQHLIDKNNEYLKSFEKTGKQC